LFLITLFFEKDGPYIKHYPSGQIDVIGTIKNGEMDGLSEFFLDNGQLGRRGNYKNGNKDGIWKYYDNGGSLTLTEVYKEGELIEKDGVLQE